MLNKYFSVSLIISITYAGQINERVWANISANYKEDLSPMIGKDPVIITIEFSPIKLIEIVILKEIFD